MPEHPVLMVKVEAQLVALPWGGASSGNSNRPCGKTSLHPDGLCAAKACAGLLVG